ncbi:hypothetical protein [Enterococcus sp. BWR-S5]|uniref:hypothetical protein n=1 Tax=Enterococcus sp. BWR-S5 TaxID=2787714 RepID=UPI00192103BA|nr:hypothetical protein [Enterococcus sp. BWR-S5]MBL1223634.1 hypothetical protein [Enterococcus sp. BWR-S5]
MEKQASISIVLLEEMKKANDGRLLLLDLFLLEESQNYHQMIVLNGDTLFIRNEHDIDIYKSSCDITMEKGKQYLVFTSRLSDQFKKKLFFLFQSYHSHYQVLSKDTRTFQEFPYRIEKVISVKIGFY